MAMIGSLKYRCLTNKLVKQNGDMYKSRYRDDDEQRICRGIVYKCKVKNGIGLKVVVWVASGVKGEGMGSTKGSKGCFGKIEELIYDQNEGWSRN